MASSNSHIDKPKTFDSEYCLATIHKDNIWVTNDPKELCNQALPQVSRNWV